MTRRPANCPLDVDDFRVNAVLVVLGITLAEAIDAFTPCYTGRLRRGPQVELVRRRVTAGLRELRHGGLQLSLQDVARLVGAPGHTSVILRCQDAERLALLTESETQSLRRGGVIPTPAIPAGEHA